MESKTNRKARLRKAAGEAIVRAIETGSDPFDLSDISGGVQHRANRHYLHAYVMCDGMIARELAHRCEHGPPPHRIKVCITKKGNEKFWRTIEEAAPAIAAPIYRPRR